jgi:hypothetical protein
MVNDTVLGSIAEFGQKAKEKNKSNKPVGTDLGLRFPKLGTQKKR